MTALAAIVRALHFASLMGVFGAAALLYRARPVGLTEEAYLRPMAIGAFIAAVTAALNLCFVTGEMVGDPSYGFNVTTVSTVVASTYYGNVFFARAVLLIGLCFLCLADGVQWLKALVAGAALAMLGLTSHAAAAGAPHYESLRAASDALHLLAAGFWVGGLAVLVPEVLPRPREPARLIGLLQLFSRYGVVSVTVLLAAGIVNAVAILDVPGMRWSPTYITLLAIKIVLAALMVALALTNRFGVLPALMHDDEEASNTIPLTVLAELGAALAILVIVGFLGLIAPMEM